MSGSGERSSYYTPAEALQLVKESGKVPSTFYRWRDRGKIERTQDGYKKEDVDAFLSTQASSSKRKQSRKKSSQTYNLEVGPPLFRQLGREDIGAAYHLQFEQVGYENAVQPTSLRKWVDEGLPLFWVAQNPQDSKDIWAVLGVLPLDEELIVRFLREEFTLQEIAITDVLTYQPGQSYTCYIIAAATPAHRGALVQLMEYLLSYWCERYPDVSIRMLYASSALDVGMEETPFLYMMKTFFFSRRRDISTSKGVWELPLDEYNPAPAVKQFQKCIKEKNMLILDKPLDRIVDRASENSDHPFNAPLQYRPARTKEDVAVMVQIGAEIFLPPGVQPSISNEHQTEVWYSWLVKNPEIFHVVTVGDKVIGYISMIPLRQDVIDRVMRGAHPTTITPDDVLMFEPDVPLDTYVHIWGTTLRLTPTQKRYASAKMLRELRKTFDGFAQRGVDIRTIWTRSNKKDGIGISQHIGMEDLEVPGVTDAPNPADRKHVFRVDTMKSENPFMVEYRQALEDYRRKNCAVSSNV